MRQRNHVDLTALELLAAGHYVETRPAICDFNHGLNRARAVTIRCLVMLCQDTDGAWLTLQGMK